MANKLTDDCEMPFGTFKGIAMENVSADYLLWLREELKGQTMFEGSDQQRVAEYIEDNIHMIQD